MRTRYLQVGKISQIVFALALLAIGLVAVFIAQGYRLGQVNDIGPGAVPLALGVVLSFLALAVVLESRKEPEPPIEIRVDPVILIPLGIIAWALIIERGGLLPATLVLVGFYALSDRPIRPGQSIILGLCLAGIGALVFIYGFRLPFSLLGE